MSFENYPVNAGIRLGSMVLDHILMCIVAAIFFVPELLLNFSTNFFDLSHEPSSGHDLLPDFSPFAILGLALYFAKDTFQGRSLAKRILGLQIIDASTGEAASPLRCFVRILSLVIWPVEFIVGLVDPERRLGDRLAGTQLVYYNREEHKTRVNWPMSALAIALAYGFISILFTGFLLPFQNLEPSPVIYVEESINEESALQLTEVLETELGDDFKADIRIYDEVMGIPDKKYISVILRMRYNFISDDDDSEELEELVKELIYQEFPEATVTGRLKFYYGGRMSKQMRTMRL